MNMGSKTGFLGVGKMGSALLKGLLNSGRYERDNIFVYDISQDKAREISESYGVKICESGAALVKECGNIVLAVKPADVAAALSQCAEFLDDSKTLISIAAGISIEYIKNVGGKRCKVARVMPNTPALVGEGATAISFQEGFDDEKRKEVIEMFQSVGLVEVLDESLMNHVIALSGSSPAYVFILIEAMADAAVRTGIKRDTAYRLAAQSVLGAAKMVLETGEHPGVLKDNVCSPNGTTIEAVYTLEKFGFRHSIMEAMQNCSIRAMMLEEKMKEKMMR
jgi:pyrroline-5-carboxylate reductase